MRVEPHEWDCGLIRETPDSSSLVLSAMYRHTERRHPSKNQEVDPQQTLNLSLPSYQNSEK